MIYSLFYLITQLYISNITAFYRGGFVYVLQIRRSKNDRHLTMSAYAPLRYIMMHKKLPSKILSDPQKGKLSH